jgi:D-glycero-alpha-D-manno-heptose 1-phosphate guanylyltransferase
MYLWAQYFSNIKKYVMNKNYKDNLSVVILVGGLGTRIRHVLGSTPKPLAIVNGRPFLDWILSGLNKINVSEVYLLTHYGSNYMERYVEERVNKTLKINIIKEAHPSGTGGSVIDFLSLNLNISSPFLLLNGDSLLLNVDINSAKEKMVNQQADGILFGVELEDASRYGTMKYNDKFELIDFDEKKIGHGLINTGIYLLSPTLFDSVENQVRPLSIESEIIPRLILGGKKFLVIKESGPFIDIGTERSLSEADNFIVENFK